jgi:hypothetical protein
MSIATVVTRGYGSFGSISLIAVRGYGGQAPEIVAMTVNIQQTFVSDVHIQQVFQGDANVQLTIKSDVER